MGDWVVFLGGSDSRQVELPILFKALKVTTQLFVPPIWVSAFSNGNGAGLFLMFC